VGVPSSSQLYSSSASLSNTAHQIPPAPTNYNFNSHDLGDFIPNPDDDDVGLCFVDPSSGLADEKKGKTPAMADPSWKIYDNNTIDMLNYTNKETVIQFAYLAWNSYRESDLDGANPGWIPLGENVGKESFGWDTPGVRGHIFVFQKSKIVVVAFKGTQTILAGKSNPYRVNSITEDKLAVNTRLHSISSNLGQYVFQLLRWLHEERRIV
jgi:hypothetical protein